MKNLFNNVNYLSDLLLILNDKKSLNEIQNELSVSPRTAHRLIADLKFQGFELETEFINNQKYYRVSKHPESLKEKVSRLYNIINKKSYEN